MPELPEVETIKRGLEGRILHQKMVRAEVLNAKSMVGEFVPGEVVGLRRRGKALIIDLDNGHSLMIHLRMTGQLIYRRSSLSNVDPFLKKGVQPPKTSMSSKSRTCRDFDEVDNRNGFCKVESSTLASLSGVEEGPFLEKGEDFAGGHPSENFVDELPNKQTRVMLEFANGAVLYFNDQRKFGFIKVLPTAEVEAEEFIRKLAKEPWAMTAAELMVNLKKHAKSAVKGAILDQTVVCGLGNIYADEALYQAKIHPERKAGSLTEAEVAELLVAMRAVMEKSIEAGGSTLKNYVKADGTRGNYLDLFVKAYGRAGQPCERCGTPLVKIKVAGRGTHFCPVCQRKEGE